MKIRKFLYFFILIKIFSLNISFSQNLLFTYKGEIGHILPISSLKKFYFTRKDAPILYEYDFKRPKEVKEIYLPFHPYKLHFQNGKIILIGGRIEKILFYHDFIIYLSELDLDTNKYKILLKSNRKESGFSSPLIIKDNLFIVTIQEYFQPPYIALIKNGRRNKILNGDYFAICYDDNKIFLKTWVGDIDKIVEYNLKNKMKKVIFEGVADEKRDYFYIIEIKLKKMGGYLICLKEKNNKEYLEVWKWDIPDNSFTRIFLKENKFLEVTIDDNGEKVFYLKENEVGYYDTIKRINKFKTFKIDGGKIFVINDKLILMNKGQCYEIVFD